MKMFCVLLAALLLATTAHAGSPTDEIASFITIVWDSDTAPGNGFYQVRYPDESTQSVDATYLGLTDGGYDNYHVWYLFPEIKRGECVVVYADPTEGPDVAMWMSRCLPHISEACRSDINVNGAVDAVDLSTVLGNLSLNCTNNP